MNGLSSREWDLLRSIYGSERHYKRRSCCMSDITSTTKINSFKDWIVMNGGEILSPAQHELVRFSLHGKIAIIWTSGTASLWGHEYAYRFYEENPDIGAHPDNAYMLASNDGIKYIRNALKELAA